MRSLVALSATAILLAAGAASAAEPGPLETFSDWTVGCDNALRCTAVGFGPEDTQTSAFMMIARDAGPDAAPEITLSLRTDQALVLSAGEGELPVSSLPLDSSGDNSASLDGEDATALIGALLPRQSLGLAVGDAQESVSLAGLSAALRFMDDRQRRAGNASALVARGDALAADVPPAPALPTQAASALREIDEPGARPDGLPEADEFCPEGFADMVLEAEDGTRLWGVCTSAGAYNLFYQFTRIEPDGSASPLDLGAFDQGFGETQGATLVNPGLSDDGYTLSALARGRGIGDCGTYVSLVFDGETLQPVEYAVMGECRGVPVDGWPVLYRAETSRR